MNRHVDGIGIKAGMAPFLPTHIRALNLELFNRMMSLCKAVATGSFRQGGC
jgi:hypothetical protein